MGQMIECKYLIKRPTMSKLLELDSHFKGFITQTYLVSDNIFNRNVKEYVTQNDLYYTYTKEFHTDSAVTEEIEESINPFAYWNLLKENDSQRIRIKKSRYVLEYRGHVFTIDLYDCDHRYAIMTVKASSPNEQVILPSVEYIKNVTNNKDFSDYMITKYKRFPQKDA